MSKPQQQQRSHRARTRSGRNGRPRTAAGLANSKNRYANQSPEEIADDSEFVWSNHHPQAVDGAPPWAFFSQEAADIARSVADRAPPPRPNSGVRKTRMPFGKRTGGGGGGGGARSKKDRRRQGGPLFDAVAQQDSKPSGFRQSAGSSSHRPHLDGLEFARRQQQRQQDVFSANQQQGRSVKNKNNQRKAAPARNGSVPQQHSTPPPPQQQRRSAPPPAMAFSGDRIPRKQRRGRRKPETVNLCDDEDSRTDSSSPVQEKKNESASLRHKEDASQHDDNDNKNSNSNTVDLLLHDTPDNAALEKKKSALGNDDKNGNTVDMLHDSSPDEAALEQKKNLGHSNNNNNNSSSYPSSSSSSAAAAAAAPKGRKGGGGGGSGRSSSSAPENGKGSSSEYALLVDTDDEQHGSEKQQQQQQPKQRSGDKRRSFDDNAKSRAGSKRAKKQTQELELDIGSSDDEVEPQAETEAKKKKSAAVRGDDGGQRALDAVRQIENDGSRVEDLERLEPNSRGGAGGMIASAYSKVSSLVSSSTSTFFSLSKAPPKPRNGRGNKFGSAAGAARSRKAKPIQPAGTSLTGIKNGNNIGAASAAARSKRGVADILAERKAEKTQKKRPAKRFNEFDSDSETEWREAASSKSSYFQQPKRTTRSQSKEKKDASKEVIEIDSSGDEEDSPARTSPRMLFAIRISIGKKVVCEDCKALFVMSGNPTMTISYNISRKTRSNNKFGAGEGVSHKIDLSNDLLLEMKYFLEPDEDSLTDDEMTNFLSLRITKNAENGLSKYPNAYDPESPELEKRYLVIEFRHEDQFADLLAAMHDCKLLQGFMDGSVLTKENRLDYCRVLEQDSEKQRRSKKSSKGPRTGFLTGKGDEDTLLVYPFGGDANEIDRTALDLNELSFCLQPDSPLKDAAATKDDDDKPQADEVETAGNAILGIKVVDYERLDPPEFLNDTLIDFWMQWVTRNSDISDIHIFTTHFYTTLAEEGVDAVKNWTQKKKRPINVFQKKLIFIPINKGLHWSLCLVVNPGAISNHCKLRTGPLDDDVLDSPFPCLLFLDSLKMHNMQSVGKHVRNWLNSEWARLNPESKDAKPFRPKTMMINSPEVPRQLNAYDCGVFVCRYAYGFLRIRSRTFSYRDAGLTEVSNRMLKSHKSLFNKSITEDEAFSFGMGDIHRIREEMKTLIERLSNIYIPFQQEKERRKKDDRKARKLAKQKADDQLKENTEANTNIVVHNPAEAADSASSSASQRTAAQPTDGADSASSSASQKPAAQPTDGTGAGVSNGDDEKVEIVEGDLATPDISNTNSSENSSADRPVQEGASTKKSAAREVPAPDNDGAIPMDIDNEATKDEAETLSASATTNAPPEEVPADTMEVEKDEATANAAELAEPTVPSADGDVDSEESSNDTTGTSSPDTNEGDDEQLGESQVDAPVAALSLDDKDDANADEEHCVEEDL